MGGTGCCDPKRVVWVPLCALCWQGWCFVDPPMGSPGSAPLGFGDPSGSLLGLPGCWHGVRLRIAPPACRVRAQGRKYPFPHPAAAYCSGLARHGGKIGHGAAL